MPFNLFLKVRSRELTGNPIQDRIEENIKDKFFIAGVNNILVDKDDASQKRDTTEALRCFEMAAHLGCVNSLSLLIGLYGFPPSSNHDENLNVDESLEGGGNNSGMDEDDGSFFETELSEELGEGIKKVTTEFSSELVVEDGRKILSISPNEFKDTIIDMRFLFLISNKGSIRNNKDRFFYYSNARSTM